MSHLLRMIKGAIGGALVFFCMAGSALAVETPIGEPKEVNGMKIAAVYLQPILMEPMSPDLDRGEADLHLEADIHALKGSPNGFGAGEWIPYLTIRYVLVRTDTGAQQSDYLYPMIASDGPHYGKQIKMMGVGNYKLAFYIDPPSYQNFGRHTDRETGVDKWWSPFKVEWTFKYLGPGKKGGY